VRRIEEELHKRIHSGPAGGPCNEREEELLRELGGEPTVGKVLRVRKQIMEEFVEQ
jgi:hypothetical protein